MVLQWMLNLLALAIVGAAAAYVLRYGARLMGWGGPGNRWRGRGLKKVQTDSAPPSGRSDLGACGAGACGQCSQRAAHGQPQGKA